MFQHVEESLRTRPRRWLVTGAAGFIGSNLVEALLKLDQQVVGLDNFATGRRDNLLDVQARVGERRWRRFGFSAGDIRSLDVCRESCRAVDVVLHQAALGSVPRSIEDPLGANASNVTGCLNMLLAARDARVARLVYASSSAVYGDQQSSTQVETDTGLPLSPYALTKVIDEQYADIFARCYGLPCIGLRYFNVFGPRQDPEGAYASVIPCWIAAMLRGDAVFINGDGETTRDFCFVENVVQANLLAAMVEDPAALNQAYNIAVGERTSLTRLFELLRALLQKAVPELGELRPRHREVRAGDVRHSLADIAKARRLLGYDPLWPTAEGLAQTVAWYCEKLPRRTAPVAQAA